MKATKRTVKALVESEVGTKLAWARRVAKKKLLGMMVSIWIARTTDGREWWVIPYPEASVYPAGAWNDPHRLLDCHVDKVFALWEADTDEQYGGLTSSPTSVG